MKRRYIADCKGFSHHYEAASDRAAIVEAIDWARESWSKGLVEVWDVRSDQLVRTFLLQEIATR
jgi:hypothetical protein